MPVGERGVFSHCWRGEHEDFRNAYERAREAQMEHYADVMIEISDNGSNNWLDREVGDGKIARVLDHEHVQRSRLRVDERTWLMGKYAPRRFGDPIAHTGPDDEPLFKRYSKKTDAQR